MSISRKGSDDYGREYTSSELAEDFVSSYLDEERAEAVVETMEFEEEAVLDELESVILGYLEGSDNLRACGNEIKLGLTEILYVSARIREDTSVHRLKEGPYWEMELDPKYNDEADFLVEVL